MRIFNIRFPDGEKAKAKHAIVPDGMNDRPGAWICPWCKDCLAESKPYCDYIQRGFEWDHTRTFMRCQQCGGYFYSDYDMWHNKPKRTKRNA